MKKDGLPMREAALGLGFVTIKQDMIEILTLLIDGDPALRASWDRRRTEMNQEHEAAIATTNRGKEARLSDVLFCTSVLADGVAQAVAWAANVLREESKRVKAAERGGQ